MINEELKLTGHVTVAVNDEVVQEIPNLVVTAGKGYVASRMKDDSASAMSHMAVGTDNSAAAAGDTALGTESGRVALTSTTVSNNVITYVATFQLAPLLQPWLKQAYSMRLAAELCFAERFSQQSTRLARTR